jgi:hypothetical protein
MCKCEGEWAEGEGTREGRIARVIGHGRDGRETGWSDTCTAAVQTILSAQVWPFTAYTPLDTSPPPRQPPRSTSLSTTMHKLNRPFTSADEEKRLLMIYTSLSPAVLHDARSLFVSSLPSPFFT